jgi:hypothetical protein
MLAEGARDFYAPLTAMLFRGTEEDTLNQFKEKFTKYMTIFEKVSDNKI